MSGLKDLSEKERDILEFVEHTGIVINPRILKSLLQLLQANVTPTSIYQLLNELAVTRTQEKIRRQKAQKGSEEKLTM